MNGIARKRIHIKEIEMKRSEKKTKIKKKKNENENEINEKRKSSLYRNLQITPSMKFKRCIKRMIECKASFYRCCGFSSVLLCLVFEQKCGKPHTIAGLNAPKQNEKKM